MPLLSRRQESFARGMNDTAAPSEYAADELQQLVNGRLGFDGTHAERRNGSKRTHVSALNMGAQGYGGFEFKTASGQVQMVVFVGDTAYYSTDNGGSWTQIATGLHTARWDAVEMRVGSTNYLLCANGSTDIYKWDGMTWGTLAGTPNGAKHLAVFNDRLFAAGHDGHTVAASEVGDPDTWNTATSSAYSVRVQTHDGDSEITGLFQIGTVLCVFKRNSTNYIEGFGTSTVTVEAAGRGVSRSVGCIAPDSIRACGDQGVMWLSERGFEFWTPGALIELASRPLQSFMDTLSWANLVQNPELPTALWWPRRHEYWCAVPAEGSQNTHIFVYRPPTRRFPAACWLFQPGASSGNTVYIDSTTKYLAFQNDDSRSQVDTVGGYLSVLTGGGSGLYVELTGGYLATVTADWMPSVLFTLERADSGADVNFPHSVGYDGFVRRMEEGDKDDVLSDGTGGSAITMTAHTRPFLFGDEFRKKWLRTVRPLARGEAGYTITVIPVLDGADGSSSSLTYTASDDLVTKKARVTGRGHQVSVKLQTTDDVKIGGVELVAKPLREAA